MESQTPTFELAAAGVQFVSARTNTGGQNDLNFSNNNYTDQSGPFTSQGLQDADNIRAVFTGKIRIDSGGATTFYTTSDDGSAIFIDGQRVVLNNAFQGAATRQGAINLLPGLHDFLMYFYEGRRRRRHPCGVHPRWRLPAGDSEFDPPLGRYGRLHGDPHHRYCPRPRSNPAQRLRNSERFPCHRTPF
jgi:hypothetical protein